ncbi:NAD(P)-binding protein [Corynespora cassiicola Philippines]|uniref:NAD(P)-binding protein n=1 Tax=Corynespora cassiicola Philippines TaxID=1448308 RepID=A0A2T2NZ62_CORCC|nr:NAD(P)-binding protein [Corynespora cassiicola Philippines]
MAARWFEQGAKFVTPVKDTYPFISDFNLGSFHGKSALVTGSSRGIGLQTAIHLAKAGCSKIALAARSSLSDAKELVEKAAADAKTDIKILTLDLDVSSVESVEAAVTEVKKAFGNLDLLVNNAAFLSKHSLIGESDPSVYWKTWETNINGTYLCTRAFLPLLLESTLKTVINMSSSGGHVVFPGASAYQTTKFAVCRFTEFLDAEYAEKGLIAIALNPGAVKTKLSSVLPSSLEKYLEDTVELSADTVVWISKERRNWLAGRFVTATWNMEELEKRKEEISEKDLLKFKMDFA